MKKKSLLFQAFIFIFAVTIFLLTGCGSKGYRSLKIYSIEGTVNINREGKTLSAAKDMKLKNEDEVVVSSSSSTILKLDSDKFIMAKENTTLKLEATGKKKNTKTRILVNDGGVIVEVKEKLKENESFEIASSNSVMAIRGTRIGFDVSKTAESISTNLVTLTGKTEIMLLKNDNLNSTNLTECLSLTYESKLSESKDITDISTLIDNSTVGHITDSDLVNVYNTEIREISTYEIDTIVDAINTFERKRSEYINGTIKITSHPDTVECGVDPKNFITVDKEYQELNFYYSKELKGDYLKYDEENVLTPGTWYCKAKSLDAYRSDPFEFEVVEKEIKFSSKPDEVDYGTDPKTLIQLDNNNYKDVDFYYSKTIDGEYKLYDASNPLELGTWYCKALGAYYSKSEPFTFDVVIAEIKFTNKPASIDYLTDPKTIIKTDKTYKNIEFYYSSTIDGEYEVYDSNYPLELGAGYFMAKCPYGYESKIYEIEISKIKVAFDFDITQKSYTGTALLNIALNDKNKVFSNEFAEIPEANTFTDYKYYITLTYEYIDSYYDEYNSIHTICFDKDHDDRTLDFIFTGENSASLDIEYNLPYYYEVTSSNSISFDFKNSIDMENSVILCTKRTRSGVERRSVDVYLSNYYCLNEESKVKLFTKEVDDFTHEVTITPLDSLSFNPDGDEILVVETYEYDGVNKDKGYYEYEIDFSNSQLVYTANIECNSSFVTFNEDDTMNIYFDIAYNGPSSDVMSFVSLTTEDQRHTPQTYMTLSKNKRFSVIEDVLAKEYHPTNASVVIKYNGVCYDLRSGDTDYTNIEPFNPYYYDVNGYISNDQTALYCDNTCFDTSNPIIVHANDNDYIIPSECLENGKINGFTIDGSFDEITIDATAYTVFDYTGNAMHTQTFDIEGYPYSFLITDELFEIVKQQMKDKYGITVKGSNKFNFKGLRVDVIE